MSVMTTEFYKAVLEQATSRTERFQATLERDEALYASEKASGASYSRLRQIEKDIAFKKRMIDFNDTEMISFYQKMVELSEARDAEQG